MYETTTLRPMRQKHSEREAESNLFRCMSDASLVKRRRGRGKSAAQTEKEKQHRFSINGHYYNYKVSFRLFLLLSLLKISVKLNPSLKKPSYVSLLPHHCFPLVHQSLIDFSRLQYSLLPLVRRLKFVSVAG